MLSKLKANGSMVNEESLSTSDSIFLFNPSFEQEPMAGAFTTPLIVGWYDCGYNSFPMESAPDIHPLPQGGWQVDKSAAIGKTYLGMVTRDNNSWESVSQKMPLLLEEKICYTVSIVISVSDKYLSGSRKAAVNELVPYTSPTILRAYGGNEFCSKNELLFESPVIDNITWKTYKFDFNPSSPIEYFTIEAYYEDDNQPPTNGHVLIDHISAINKINCS